MVLIEANDRQRIVLRTGAVGTVYIDDLGVVIKTREKCHIEAYFDGPVFVYVTPEERKLASDKWIESEVVGIPSAMPIMPAH